MAADLNPPQLVLAVLSVCTYDLFCYKREEATRIPDMRFDKKRAVAFAEYAVTEFLERMKQGGGNRTLAIDRRHLLAALDVKRLWAEHVEIVRVAAASQGVAMANMNERFFFFYADEVEDLTEKAAGRDVIKLADLYSKIYGSEAADDMWDSRITKDARASPRKIAPATRVRGR